MATGNCRVNKSGKIYVVTNSPQDLEYVRKKAIENREEIPSAYNPLHTIYLDGPWNLARDRENIFAPPGVQIPMVNTKERSA